MKAVFKARLALLPVLFVAGTEAVTSGVAMWFRNPPAWGGVMAPMGARLYWPWSMLLWLNRVIPSQAIIIEAAIALCLLLPLLALVRILWDWSAEEKRVKEELLPEHMGGRDAARKLGALRRIR